DFVEAGEVVLAGEHALELVADRAPVSLDVAHPGENRVVVDRRIADGAEPEIEPLHQRHDPHEHARDEARPAHRPDAFGAETLPRLVPTLCGPGRCRQNTASLVLHLASLAAWAKAGTSRSQRIMENQGQVRAVARYR